jgi:hypothetical protein
VFGAFPTNVRLGAMKALADLPQTVFVTIAG